VLQASIGGFVRDGNLPIELNLPNVDPDDARLPKILNILGLHSFSIHEHDPILYDHSVYALSQSVFYNPIHAGSHEPQAYG